MRLFKPKSIPEFPNHRFFNLEFIQLVRPMAVEQNEIFYSVENQPDAKWDREWAEDWQKVVEIYSTIEHLKYCLIS